MSELAGVRLWGVALAVAIAVAFVSSPILAETVEVKYRGRVDLKPFQCRDVSRSSFINRVCYDAANQYMLISLNGTYYHYCETGLAIVSNLLNAESMGRYFNSSIKGRFDCRVFRVPKY
jgi:hypothetical protein